MVVPFQLSFSDIAAAISVVKQVLEGFSETKGARKKFAESYNFLKAFKVNLELISDYLKASSQGSCDAVNDQLEVVRTAYEKFANYLERKYGLRATASSKLRTALHTVQWALNELHDEVQKMRQALSETLLTLQMWLQFELSKKMDRMDENVSCSSRKLTAQHDGTEERLKTILDSQKSWERIAKQALDDWQDDLGSQRNEAQASNTELTLKIDRQASALTEMRAQNDTMVTKLDEYMLSAQKSLDEKYQLSPDAEAATEAARQSLRIQEQRQTLHAVTNSSQQAVRRIGNTVKQIKVPNQSYEQIVALVSSLDKSLKAISVSPPWMKMVGDVETFFRQAKSRGRTTAKAFETHIEGATGNAKLTYEETTSRIGQAIGSNAFLSPTSARKILNSRILQRSPSPVAVSPPQLEDEQEVDIIPQKPLPPPPRRSRSRSPSLITVSSQDHEHTASALSVSTEQLRPQHPSPHLKDEQKVDLKPPKPPPPPPRRSRSPSLNAVSSQNHEHTVSVLPVSAEQLPARHPSLHTTAVIPAPEASFHRSSTEPAPRPSPKPIYLKSNTFAAQLPALKVTESPGATEKSAEGVSLEFQRIGLRRTSTSPNPAPIDEHIDEHMPISC